ncbi:MAG: hypothetical protein IKE21_01545 [Erysipelotrichaceae bacterium]|nr:hypothetical protein [Erysipelotrichaceae bacterium]
MNESTIAQNTPCDTEDRPEYYDAYAEIGPEEDVQYSVSEFSRGFDPDDPLQVAQFSNAIALVHVISIDGGDNRIETLGTYSLPYTKGKMEILKVFHGEIPEGETLEYRRMGGTLTFSQYLEGQPEASRKKMLSLMKTPPAYVSWKSAGDIDIEAGKTYLAYLTHPDYTLENVWYIVGEAGGLRELDVERYIVPDVSDLSALRVRNNYTDSWEELVSVPGLD